MLLTTYFLLQAAHLDGPNGGREAKLSRIEQAWGEWCSPSGSPTEAAATAATAAFSPAFSPAAVQRAAVAATARTAAAGAAAQGVSYVGSNGTSMRQVTLQHG